MSERRYEVQWVPTIPDQFVTWGSDLRLYKVVDDQFEGGKVVDEYLQVGPNRWAHLLASLSEPHYIKCVDLWRGEGVVAAAGQPTGRVSLVTFSPDQDDLFSERELLPKVPRPCSGVAWNPTSKHLLAGGFEKVRNDYGAMVWEVGQARTDKPALEIGQPGDHCSSLSWCYADSYLVTGMNMKSVKIFDTRNPQKHAHMTHTKATYGLSVDPGSDYRISGHSETQIVIWDTRNFDKPIITLNTNHQVTRLAWCPTRHGLLANCVRDSGAIMLRDIMSWAVTQEDGEASVTERSILPPSGQIGNIADFAWHPSKENTLLAMGIHGKFAKWMVADRLTLNWSSRHGIVWSSGGSNLLTIEPTDEEISSGTAAAEGIEDIGLTMLSRAKNGYTGVASLAQADKLKLEPHLRSVWEWILHIEELCDLNLLPTIGFNTKMLGVRSFIKAAAINSQLCHKTWTGLEAGQPIRTYVSEERDIILKLCGWEEKKLAARQPVTAADVARHAAIAVFNLDLKSALETLKTGCTNARNTGDSELADRLSMVCVAVSGYSTDGAKLWREMVATSLLPSIPDPALRSLFAFLTTTEDNYTVVLEERGLDLIDRIAFSAKFLSDRQLMLYLDSLWAELLAEGNVLGLLLTSSHGECVEILQAYVDRSGDVQSASWLAMRSLPPDALKTERVATWIESFRQMLDQWNMFGERSELDIAITTTDLSRESAQQVFIACHFCGKSISNVKKGSRVSNTGSLSKQGGVNNKAKSQACPSCRKPLPRCAVCLVNMGTVAGSSLQQPPPGEGKPQSIYKVNRFGEWFTWCQTCRHGGHADHLLDWFESHQDCPVTGCSCKCASLDANTLSAFN